MHVNGQGVMSVRLGNKLKLMDNKPLKVLVKHYSTKLHKRCQVEEVMVHFYHEDSSRDQSFLISYTIVDELCRVMFVHAKMPLSGIFNFY